MRIFFKNKYFVAKTVIKPEFLTAFYDAKILEEMRLTENRRLVEKVEARSEDFPQNEGATTEHRPLQDITATRIHARGSGGLNWHATNAAIRRIRQVLRIIRIVMHVFHREAKE